MVMRTTRIAPIHTHVTLSSIPKYREIPSPAMTPIVQRSHTSGTKAKVTFGMKRRREKREREKYFFIKIDE